MFKRRGSLGERNGAGLVGMGCAVVGASLVVCGLGGCRAMGLDEATVETGPVYPQEARQVGVLDVQVIRRGTSIELTNSTGEVLAGRLWLNRWWAGELAAVEPGQTARVSLHGFVDRYNEGFRAGGFFATEQPTKLVHVQLERGGGGGSGGLVGLVVIGEEE